MYKIFDHPLTIGGGSIGLIESLQHLPTPDITTNQVGGILQIVVGIITIVKLIFPKKEKLTKK